LVVGFVGRVGREKGICELHRAWSDLRDRCASAYLLLVGPREAADPVPEGTWRELADDPRVRVTGLDWNTPPLYAAMDLLCLPSHREGCPNVPLEAAAMELPVVAFRVPGMIDTVEDGVTGCLIEPMRVAALTGALYAYLLDPEARRQHGLAGRERVVARFSRAIVWTALTTFYSSLAADCAAGTARRHRTVGNQPRALPLTSRWRPWLVASICFHPTAQRPRVGGPGLARSTRLILGGSPPANPPYVRRPGSA
jgi:glycosyltransferase involved in cell wall biosynthesis